jgi:signal transduction histidine kinase
LTRIAAGFLALIYLLAALVLIAVSLQLARRWSRYFSAPIEELTGWVQRIQQREALPAHAETVGAPEFESLQTALREMSDALEHARLQELERERLVAFREIARRVAHEIRGPLTSSRLALDQLERRADDSAASGSAVQVLGDEVRRLEQMAKEFSEFGRLPEGPEAEIDIGQLLDSVIQATVPQEIPVQRVTDERLVVHGHYEPLRRAVQNLLRNAIDVTSGEGITVHAHRTAHGVTLSIRDHGPGVDPQTRDRIFEPYFTTKESGTGLGLAIVRQTVQVHGGTIAVDDAPGGGATFTIDLPAAS